jgi:hypothetical protein
MNREAERPRLWVHYKVLFGTSVGKRVSVDSVQSELEENYTSQAVVMTPLSNGNLGSNGSERGRGLTLGISGARSASAAYRC